MPFVFNDYSKQYGWGKETDERLKFSWDVIAAQLETVYAEVLAEAPAR